MSKANLIQAIRGMNDILPDTISDWHYIESIFKNTVEQFDFKEIRFPILESLSLFKRSIGDVTDVVEKEMYAFEDRNGDWLALRPEGTAGCVRAGIQNGLFYNQIQKLFYSGPMFRHERPQKGRYRQFYQFGIESFGIDSILSDVELIELTYSFFKTLNLLPHIKLEINTLGTLESREKYTESLKKYFKNYINILTDHEQSRLESNPLRLLDSKNPELKNIIQNAPNLLDFLKQNDPESYNRFKSICDILDQIKIKYTINPHLVRGLDYYTHTVFEWVTDDLGAQSAVCAGGRYDGLVEQLGGQATPAVGCAMGIERLILLLNTHNLIPDLTHSKTVYIVYNSIDFNQIYPLVYSWRENININLKFILDPQGNAFKKQFKRADKSNADWAVIIGTDELSAQKISIKQLKSNHSNQSDKLNISEQLTMGFDDFTDWLTERG